MTTTFGQQFAAIQSAMFDALHMAREFDKDGNADAAAHYRDQAAALDDAASIISALYRARRAGRELDALLASMPEPEPDEPDNA